MSQQDFETIQEYYDNLQPKKCVGCECSHLVYSEPDKGLVWECDLQATGEPCYMGNESYNPKWTIECAELRRGTS